MSVDIYQGERSKESIQFEKWLFSQSNKESFSSIENTKIFLDQKKKNRKYAAICDWG